MKSISGIPALDDPAAAAKLTDPAWVALHVPRFDKWRARYEEYGTFLDGVLREFCRRVAPLAIVQVRAKKVSSFAEKILRKRDKYASDTEPLPPDPLVRLTDLCGARVIVQTSAQVAAIRRLVERCFDIDRANSDDASTRLKATEFGYRTINYIVMANPEKLREAGIDVPVPQDALGSVRPESPDPVRLKAEIQIRTLLEHAYADIGHDLTYKTEVNVPRRIHRSFSAVAAALESADQEFGRLVESLDEFKSNYGAYHTRQQVEDEIQRLRVVLANQRDNPTLAVRMAQLANGIGDFEGTLEVLEPYRDRADQGVQQALGTALVERHWENPRDPHFKEGRSLLDAACRHQEKNAELLCSLAECWTRGDDEDKAGELFREALSLDAAEPRSLCCYLEYQIRRTSTETIVRFAEPMIRAASERCRLQIEGGVNLPNAWSSLAVFQLLLEKPYPALDALCHLFALCERPADGKTKGLCAADRALVRLRTTLASFRRIKEKLVGFDWFERAVLIGLAVRIGDAEAAVELRARASGNEGEPVFKPEDRIVILSGGCSPEVDAQMPPFGDALSAGVRGLSFVLVSGGTQSGISGIADRVAGESNGAIRAIGYLPKPIFRALTGTRQTGHYSRLIPSAGADFTPLDPLQAWTDLVAAGVDPVRVKLLAYAGKTISKVECTLALALGAKVGVLVNPDLPKERQFDDPAWIGHANYLPLPVDPMTLHAFVRIDEADLSEADRMRLEPAARQAHEDYVKKITPTDPSLQPWEQLDESLKRSNLHQIAYWEKLLQDFGLGIRPLTEEDKKHAPLDLVQAIGKDNIRKLAEMEHGRWNVERLGYGWRFAPVKSIPKRHSPYLIPWRLVTPEVQNWDVDAIEKLPGKLRKIDREMVKI